jgi:glycosyltransferase involved in cell wall biosynthesis
MKVLYVIEYSSMTGGMLRSVEMLIQYIRPLGVSSAVMLPCKGQSAEAFKGAGASIFVDPDDKSWVVSVTQPLRTFATTRRFSEYLKAVVKEFKPDLIHTSNIAAELLVAIGCRMNRLGVRRIFSQRGNVYRGISRRALRWSLKHVSAVVVTTPYQLETTMAVLGVPEEKITIIPNGTDLHRQPTPQKTFRSKWTAAEDTLVFAVVGYPSSLKCQETFIEAADITKNSIPNAKFVIVGEAGSAGDKIYLRKLRKMVAELHLHDRVVFAGYCANTRELMDSIDVLVSTSLFEGFGRTIIEAWACKRPAISTRVGGPRCIVNHGKDGFLFAPKNAQELAEYMIKLGDPSIRSVMGEAGYNQVLEKYDAKKVAQEHLKLYRSILQGS